MFVKSITLGIIVLVFFGLVNTVDAQSYDLHLVLNPLESSISEGDVLGFSGILTTSDQQYVITDAAIVIKDDVDFGSDRVIATGYTDENGEFFISWVAKTRQSGGSYDFYAVFEESDLKTRSVTHNVSVTSATQNYVSILTLDPISSLVQQGNKIVFSGILKTTTGEVVTGFPIFIKDDREGISDIVLKTTVTDSNGKFSTTWDAVPRNSGSYDIYAEFKGGENISKSRSDTFSVKVSGTPSASGKLSTKLLLNNIPSSIYTGNVITFTGKLTSDGIPLSGKLIQIKEDDPFLVDQRLGYGRTNSNGEFFIDWNITPGLVETDFDVHATFDGDDLYNIARTANQEMSVVRLWSSITLDSIPQNVDVGGQVTFSGNVQLEKGSPEGYVVYVMDEDAFDDDDLLATAYVNGDGSYSIIWSAERVDADNIADIYVVFEGTSIYYRSTTCDDDNTFDFGGDCLNTIKLKTIGVTLEPDPVYQPPTSGYKFNGDEYMELYYALSFNKNPVIAIIPQPDSYDEVKPYFIPIQEGIRTWNLGLEKTGGDWNVDFDIIKPGEKFPQRPDVIINVVAYDDDIDCGYTRGVAWISGEKPLNSKVCATSFGKPANPDSVSATSGHEFIHTIGLGHAFNKKGDVMCSVENGKSTCPSLFGGKSKFPNDFNFEAVKVMYGKDGWKNPNYSVTYGEKFTVNDFNSEQPIVTTNPINEPDDYEENLVDHLSVYFTSPNSIEFYGSTVSCQDNFGDSVYVKIFNPYGKNIISKNISLTNSCWFESKVSLNFDDVIEGEWKIIAKYFDSTNESNFTIYSWETPVTPTPVTPTPVTPTPVTPTPVTPTPTVSEKIDVYTDSNSYSSGSLVSVRTSTASNANVAISVSDSDGNNIVTRTVTVDNSGKGEVQFKLSSSAKSGTYVVDATATVSGKKISDSTKFTVSSISSGNITIVSLSPTDQQGNPVSSFTKGKLGFVNVVLDSDSSTTSLVTINLFDSQLTSLGIGSFKTTLNSGQSEMSLSFFIPNDAEFGSGDIYANVFSDWPSQGGVPLTG
ncbi:MAG: hypothetical protein HOB51_02230, partial [Thaumarchaeota archaeon]|nr:hypothetical protein [Nitrososphaerota archaeon]